MFDMIDVIQMTKISKHYLLEYQTLLDSYEMQAPNVTSGFRVLDFSDDISDVDYTSDDWSMNESYSETSGEMTNSVQANLLSNPPEYSVCAGSKPLSIIIRRCNTPTAVCSSPVQETDKENSCTDSNSVQPVHCDVTNLFICQEQEHALGSGESDKAIKWATSESTDIVNVCNRENGVSESKDERLNCSTEITLCKSPNREFANVVGDVENYTEEKDVCHLQKCDESFPEQNEQSSVSLLPCVEEDAKNDSYSFSCTEEENGKNILDNTIQKVVDDLCFLANGRENLDHSENISCSVVSVNSSCNIDSDNINVPKQQSHLKDELHHYVNDVPLNSTTVIFHHPQVSKEHLNFTDTTEDIEVNYLTSSFCHTDNVQGSDKNNTIENCVREQSNMYLEESFDINSSDIMDGLRPLSCSPLLFSSDDESSSIMEEVNRGIEAALAPSPQSSSYNVVLSNEKKKVGKLQELLMGAPPPPAVTMPLHSASDMLRTLKDTPHWAASETAVSTSCRAGVQWYQEAATMPWPQVKCLQYPGIHYNHGSVSEQFESLCQKLLTRCVGSETASSVTVWSSFTLPAPRRERRMLSTRRSGTEAPTGLSPGRRLSHLARRHRTFCSASLLNDGARLHSALPHAAPERRTILVDGRKKESRKQRSSQKKKNEHHDRKDVHTMKLNSSKRALFQSPTEEEKKATASSKFRPSSASAVRSRRALFVAEQSESQSKCPSTSCGENTSASRKRLRTESEEEGCEGLPRRRLFSDAETNVRPVTSNGNTRQTELSSTHKKKLLWAVAEALKKRGVGLTHPQFRACAAALASTCRGHVPEVLALRQGSTSDRLLQLALRFVDEAVLQHIQGHPAAEQTRTNEVG